MASQKQFDGGRISTTEMTKRKKPILILGTGMASSSITPLENKMDYFVSFDSVSIWKKPIKINPLVEKLY